MNRGGLNIAISAYLFFIAIGNVVTGLTEVKPLIEWIPYVGIPLIISILIYIFRNRLSDRSVAAAFLVFSLASVLSGDHGNLTGAIFLCYALYVFENRRLVLASILAISIAVMAKAVISEFTIAQTIKYIAGMTFVPAIFYLLVMRSKRPIMSKLSVEDYETCEVVRLVVDGLSYKEIGDRLNVSSDAISKRLERARKRMGAKSNEHLAVLMSRNGHIIVN